MLTTLTTLASNIPTAAVAAITAGLLRSAAGWIENCWKDGKAEDFEWKQLLGTIVKYFGSISLLMLGTDAGLAVVGSFLLDAGTSAVKSLKK